MSELMRQSWFRGSVGCALGAGVGLLAWDGQHTPVMAVLLPLFWILASGAFEAFMLVLGYQAVATSVLAVGALTFGQSPSQIGLQLAGWSLQSTAVACLWAFAWRLGSKSAVRHVAAGIIVQLALLLPPLWLLGTASPVVWIGSIAGGTGWYGLATGLVAPLALGGVVRDKNVRSKALAVVAITPLLFGVRSELGLDMHRAPGLYGVDVRWGDSGQSGLDHVVDRIPKIGAALRAVAQDSSIKTVVFPEAVLGGIYEDASVVVKIEIESAVRTLGVQALIGADRLVDGRPRVSLRVVNPLGPSLWIDARQPTPVSLWRPFDPGSYSADWTRPSELLLADGRTAYISFCHEDVVPGLFLMAMLKHPDVVISVANNWWMPSDKGSNQQARHVQAYAKLFGLPLVRAVNRPVLSRSF